MQDEGVRIKSFRRGLKHVNRCLHGLVFAKALVICGSQRNLRPFANRQIQASLLLLSLKKHLGMQRSENPSLPIDAHMQQTGAASKALGL